MGDRKPTIPVVVEDENEKQIVTDAATKAGFDNPGAYIRALLQRDGVTIRQQKRGGWRGEPKAEQQETLSPHAKVPENSSGLLCIETADTP